MQVGVNDVMGEALGVATLANRVLGALVKLMEGAHDLRTNGGVHLAWKAGKKASYFANLKG